MPTIMEKFFEPKSVAVIGASESAGKPGNVVIRNMILNGFTGKIYLVNPRGGKIEGLPVFRSIKELPTDIDQAIVTLPATLVPQTIRALAEKKIMAIVLAASGFAEVDQMGGQLQQKLRDEIKATGVRVIGPNTTGHISVPGKFTSSFFPLGKVPSGNISYIAQTGNFCGISIRHMMSAENYGIARSCGLGNKVDLDECDILEFYGRDDATKSIFMYLEHIANPPRFLRVARRVSRSKPIFLLKGGISEAGAAAAQAHTGSLATDGRIVSGAIRQAGVTQLGTYSQLFHVAKAVDMMPLPKRNRVSFLSPSGAFTVCLTDICKSLNLDVPQLEEKNSPTIAAPSAIIYSYA